MIIIQLHQFFYVGSLLLPLPAEIESVRCPISRIDRPGIIEIKNARLASFKYFFGKNTGTRIEIVQDHFFLSASLIV